LVNSAARDFDAFYQRRQGQSAEAKVGGSVLVISVDGKGVVMLVTSLGFGTLLGLLGALLLVTLLKRRNVVPEGIESVFTLCLILAMFQGSNVLLPESGMVPSSFTQVLIGKACRKLRFSGRLNPSNPRIYNDVYIALLAGQIGATVVTTSRLHRFSQLPAVGGRVNNYKHTLLSIETRSLRKSARTFAV
jgi:hypothetical protein